MEALIVGLCVIAVFMFFVMLAPAAIPLAAICFFGWLIGKVLGF